MYSYTAYQQRDTSGQKGKSVKDYFLKELTMDMYCNIYNINCKIYLYNRHRYVSDMFIKSYKEMCRTNHYKKEAQIKS